MCTVNDDDGELLMLSKESMSLSERVCRSCDNAAKVVLRKKDTYCKSCFLNSAIHKFRATLGKSKMLKAGDKVLLIFTGNASSIALLHFLYSGLNEKSNKRLLFNVDLLFIDDALVSGASFEKRQETVNQAKSIAKSFGFKIFITTVSEVLSEIPFTDSHLVVRKHLEDQMKEIFDNVKSVTAKDDLLHQLRHKLILKVGMIIGYNKVFLPDVGTDLAVKLLVGISLGRGDQISAEMGFCDNTVSTIAVLRPLKDFTQKEIIFYIVFQQIEPMTMVPLINMYLGDISIQKTAEKFVNDLQEKFPSTVYTIFRTGDKLKMSENYGNEEHKKCMLCNNMIKDSSAEICDVVAALDFSRKVSEAQDQKSISCCNNCSCVNQNESFSKRIIEQYLCYGCTLILKDTEKKDVFWTHLLKEEIYARNIQNLKNQVAEFLIN